MLDPENNAELGCERGGDLHEQNFLNWWCMPCTGWQSKASKAPPTEADSSSEGTGAGRCAYTLELVKPVDPEGTERQSAREQRESWLWIKVLPHRR